MTSYPDNSSSISQDDGVWILTSSFIIFTMQSGFGLLESGSVSSRNEVNIMIKNVVDVVFGGLSYWLFGFGLSYGRSKWSNPLCGFGSFFFDPEWEKPIGSETEAGWGYAKFMFQLGMATTAGTVVSGAMAERAYFKSYIVFSFFFPIVQAVPAHWLWAENGFLNHLGVIDIAGSAGVHLVGGTAGLVAEIVLGSRDGRWILGKREMSSPINALLGTFMLWWGWLGFNCGSTWGVTRGRWNLAARGAVATIMASIGGGVTALLASYAMDGKCKIDYLINGLLASLVSITALCALARPWQALIIGSLGALLALKTVSLLEKFKIDDPVGIIPTHFVASIWGMLAVGIFAESDRIDNLNNDNTGLIHRFQFYLLGIQLLACVCIILWTGLTSYLILQLLKLSPLGLRMTADEEFTGADIIEHDIHGSNVSAYKVNDHVQRVAIAVKKAAEHWVQKRNRSRSPSPSFASAADIVIANNSTCSTSPNTTSSMASSARNILSPVLAGTTSPNNLSIASSRRSVFPVGSCRSLRSSQKRHSHPSNRRVSIVEVREHLSNKRQNFSECKVTIEQFPFIAVNALPNQINDSSMK